jgi:hypothetical protein
MRRFLESNWSQIAPRLKEKYRQLSESDLEIIEGEELTFLKKLEWKLNISRDALIREMKELITLN